VSLLELTRPLRRGLGRLRRRVRGLLVLLGASRTLVFLAVALVLFFLADYFLRLPLWVRGIALVGVLAGAGTVLFRRLLRPLAHPLDDARLAARVELAHPALADRLKSSLAFAHAHEDPENEDSPELMRVVVEETVREASALRFVDVANNALAVRWAVGAAVLLVGVLVATVAQKDLVGTFAQRSLLLRDVAWPRRTTLVVEDMTPGEPRRVTLGRETTVAVRAIGSVPDRVQLALWERDSDPRAARRVELTPSPEDPALFALTLRVLTSSSFTVTGGDDDRALVYTIEALTPPSILSLEMDVAYPEYLERKPETLTGGGQRLPEGTRARLRMRTNMGLRLASIAVGADDPRPFEVVDETTYETDLEAEKDTRYSIRLVGTNGEENDPGVDTFFLQVARDQAPTVRVRAPGPRAERLAGGVVLIPFDARDDHRVTGVRFQYRVNDGEERTVAVGESGGDAIRTLAPADASPERVVGVVAVDLARLRGGSGAAVAKGDRLTYHFEASDSADQVERTHRDQRIDLVTEEELTVSIENRQQELRDSVRRATNRARDAADMLDYVQDARQDPAEFRRWTGRAQAAQARVIDDLDSLSRRVQGLVNLYVFNRLHDRSAADQILPFYERHLLEPTERTGIPYRGRLYRALATALRERQIRASSAYAKLIEMADLGHRLAADYGPEAYRALGRVGVATAPADLESALEEVRTAQRTIADGLAKLARLMREWENFDSVVRWFKGLRDTEENIVNELKGLEKAK